MILELPKQFTASRQQSISFLVRFLEEERMEGEKESVLPSVGEERIGGAYTLKKRERGGAVERNVDPYIIIVGIKRRKRGCRKFRKG